MALTRFEKDQIDLPTGSLSQPEFVFDKQGRCLYKMYELHSTEKTTVTMSYILDLYTNQQVAVYTTSVIDGNSNTSGDRAQFENVDKKYFGAK